MKTLTFSQQDIEAEKYINFIKMFFVDFYCGLS